MGRSNHFPKKVLAEQREEALLFKQLATLRTDAPLFKNVDELLWRGPMPSFQRLTEKMGEQKLLARANSLYTKVNQTE